MLNEMSQLLQTHSIGWIGGLGLRLEPRGGTEGEEVGEDDSGVVIDSVGAKELEPWM